MMGIAQHYLTCPANHVVKIQAELMLRDAKYYGIDGVVFHASRTCRAWSNSRNVMSQIVQRELGIPTMFFEGDIADAAFYKDDLLDSRLEAMLEAIDVRRVKGASVGGPGRAVARSEGDTSRKTSYGRSHAARHRAGWAALILRERSGRA